MPGANEALGCPSKIFSSIRPGKFPTTFFSHSSHHLSTLTKICSLDAPQPSILHNAPVTTFYSSFVLIYLEFF